MTITADAPRFVKAVTCPRCKGTGFVSSRVAYWGVPGTCFGCDGLGEVEGDRATRAAAKAKEEARKAAGLAVYRDDLGYGVLTGAPAAEQRQAREFRDAVTTGFHLLEANDPDRFAKAVESVNAGHPRVFVALATYAVVEHGYRTPLGRDIVAPDGTTIGA